MSDPINSSSTPTRLPGKAPVSGSNVLLSLWITICALLVTSAGFSSFSVTSRDLTRPLEVKADGIIVLTGGSERISAGLELLNKGLAKRLLISGVHPATSAAQLRSALKADAELFKCCVDLDKNALDTRGNAVEAALWVKKNSFKRLFIVTSDYHILRSMLEFSRTMPDHELIAYSVSGRDSGDPMASRANFKLWLNEYIKYLLALVRLKVAD